MTASGDGSGNPWRRRAALAGWGLLVFAIAWASGRRVAEGPAAVTRVYDVRDLLVEVPDFDNAPQLGFRGSGGGTGKPVSRPTPTTQPTTDARAVELAALVRRSIDPDTWEARPRAVTPLAGQLVVTQTPDVHARVAEFLREMREARQVTVTIAAKLITVDESILRRLPSPTRERLLAEPPAGVGGSATATTGPAPASAEDVAAIMDAVRSGRGAGTSVLTAPQVTLFSGQRAYVMVSNQRAYVADFTATSQPSGQWTVASKTAIVEGGALFDVRAAASADRTSVTLDLRQQVSNVLAMDTTATTGPTGMTIPIQRPSVDLRTLHTALTIPNRRTAIVSAFSTTASSGTTRTFLLVTPTIAAPPASAEDRVFPKPR